MGSRKRLGPQGFTLVELLTVILVIALLIGILVPAFNLVRDQARNTKTRGQLSTIEKGCELFNGELGKYPRSHGRNPFEGSDSVVLTGAQWLAVQLVGPDMQGYVKPDRQNDTDDDGEVWNDPDDWLEWYDLEEPHFPRLDRFVPTEGGIIKTFRAWAEEHPGHHVEGDLQHTGDRWANDRIPFFVDAYGLPILYYAANAFAEEPFSTGTGSDLEYGRYDQSDNAGFTGTEGDDGRNPGYQAGLDPYGDADKLAGTDYVHPLAILAYVEDQRTLPAPPEPLNPDECFARYFMDENLFESSRSGDEGRIWPHNPDTFVLISPGKDGLWGTKDDVSNIQRGD